MKTRKYFCVLSLLAFVLLAFMALLPINSFADNGIEFVETEEKTFDQNYNLSVVKGDYKDVKKLRLSWTVNDITAKSNQTQLWNPEQMKWDDNSTKNDIITTDGSAEFIITNFSSVKVDVALSFKAEEGFNPTVSFVDNRNSKKTTGKITVGTVVKPDKEVDTSLIYEGTIEATLKPNSDFLTKSDVADSKYGTYTLTLSKAI